METFQYPADVYNTQSAEYIFPILEKIIGPLSSILDVGCGNGSWLSAFKKHKTQLEICGIDYDPYGSRMKIDQNDYYNINLTQSFHLNKQFDLVISLEVAEHLSPSYSEIFIESLVNHGSTILFSAAIPGQGGVEHLNEQWQSYWFEKFDRHGFMAYDIRSLFWSEPRVDFWYKQNMILYSKNQIDLPKHTSKSVDVVHPEMWKYKKQYPEEFLKDIYKGNIGISNSFQLLLKSLKVRFWDA